MKDMIIPRQYKIDFVWRIDWGFGLFGTKMSLNIFPNWHLFAKVFKPVISSIYNLISCPSLWCLLNTLW